MYSLDGSRVIIAAPDQSIRILNSQLNPQWTFEGSYYVSMI